MMLNAIHALQLRIKKYFPTNETRNFVLLIAMFFFSWLFYCNSWIGDDAFITMRVVDNLSHGYGLVWNTGERVQAFSHPLWLFFVTLVYWIVKDPYYTLHYLSFIVSSITVFLLFKCFAATSKKIVISGLLLTASMSFIDFSSSGLENPLSHLLLVLTLICVFNVVEPRKRLLLITLFTALSTLNRLDTILIYLPILVYEYKTSKLRWSIKGKIIFICSSPVWLWLIFAIIYYGFPFPNTYYAKIAIHNLSLQWFLLHGSQYYLNFIKWDPVSFMVIVVGIVFSLIEHNGKKLMLAGGMILYLLYVLYIGGDFMSGRFFSTVFLLSLILILGVNFQNIIPVIRKVRFKFVVVFCFFLCLISTKPPLLTRLLDAGCVFDKYAIANEKYYYYDHTSWKYYDLDKRKFDWVDIGLAMKASDQRTYIFCNIGFAGYSAGPDVYIIDGYALTDPLLARLPAYENSRIGHFARDIPDGYEKTVTDYFENNISDESLHQYYDRLSVLIHDPIFSKQRMIEIVNFATGKYDYLVIKYSDSFK
jgi:arabinofuranosyltransferase